MSFARVFGASATVIIAISGCNILKSDEEQCLQSARLSFKDPDSLKVVQNLGDRGQSHMKDGRGFWLRYSATNAYGGRISSNMACEKVDDRWVRSNNFEQYALAQLQQPLYIKALKATTLRLNQNTEAIIACKTSLCVAELQARPGSNDPEKIQASAEQEAYSEAKEIVFDGIGQLN